MSAGARPWVSVLLVCEAAQPDAAAVRDCVDSVRAQTSPDWELLLVRHGPGERPAGGWARAAAADSRIRLIDAGPQAGASDAANHGVAVALGDLLVPLRPGDTLAPAAVAAVAAALDAHPDLDLLYSDEDVPADGPAGVAAGGPAGVAAVGSAAVGSPAGRTVLSKPDWSPERFRHGDYVGGLLALRTGTVRDVGGYRAGFGGARDYDLALRVSEQARQVAHLPLVLLHRGPRDAADGTDGAAARRAAQDHLDRVGIAARVAPGPAPGYHRVRRRLESDTSVSIIVPTRGQQGTAWGQERTFVVQCVQSALARTEHRNLEIVVVYDEPTPPEVLGQLREIAGDRLVTVAYTAPFNFSQKCNVGFLHSGGDVVVLLNDDIEVESDRWLEQLIAPLREPDVGLAGARLLYPDRTLQHAGHVYARKPAERTLRHAYHRRPAEDHGELGALVVNRETSGVTAACAALRRPVYDAAGGLSERLPGNYNDVDLSLKIAHLGLRVLWVAECTLYHFESRTRERRVHPYESAFITKRWGEFTRDRYSPTG